MVAGLQRELQEAKAQYKKDLQMEKDLNAELITNLMTQHKESLDTQDSQYRA